MSLVKKSAAVFFVMAAVVTLIAIATLFFVRLIALPYCEEHPDKVAEALSQQIGQPVTLNSVSVGWDGWNPEFVIKEFKVFDRLSRAENTSLENAIPQLDLPDITMVIGWRSLFFMSARFVRLSIDAPKLIIRRAKTGQLFAGGLLISEGNASSSDSAQESGFSFAEWLEKQSAIEIKNGAVLWIDESRAAPPLQIQNFMFFGSPRRISITGDLDTETPIAFNIKAEKQSWLRYPKGAWRWTFRSSEVDFNTLTQWFDFPLNIKSGRGQFVNEMTLVNREVTEFALDVKLFDAAVRLLPDEWGDTDDEKESAAELPLLQFKEASGRLTGARELVAGKSARYAIHAKDFSFTSGNGTVFPPSDISLFIKTDQTPRTLNWLQALTAAKETRLTFPRLDIKPLREALDSLPLPSEFRAFLAKTQFEGLLKNGDLTAKRVGGHDQLLGSLDFVEVTGKAIDAIPGIQKLSGRLSLHEKGGQFVFDTKNATLDLPLIFAEEIPIAGFTGLVAWRMENHHLHSMTFKNLRITNNDLEGVFEGQWRADENFGVIDLSGGLSRAAATGVYRYIPNIVGNRVQGWLKESLVTGNASNARLILKGELAHFPFDEAPDKGEFSVEARVSEGVLQYQPNWTPITGIEADLSFKNATMTITAKAGLIDAAQVKEAVVGIKKLNADFPVLTVNGNTEGELGAYLNFVEQTPVREKTDRFLDGAKGHGNTKLSLALAIPLSLNDPAIATIEGHLTLDSATLLLPDVPPLSKVLGEVTFTENNVTAPALAFSVLGGSATAQLKTVNNRIDFQSKGTFNAALLKEVYPVPALAQLSGVSHWAIKLTRAPQQTEWTLVTPLTGVAINLPEPFRKAAEIEAPLKIRRSQGKQGVWYINYDAPTLPLAMVGLEERAGDHWKLARAAVEVGNHEVGLPNDPLISVRAVIPTFNLSEWLEKIDTLFADQAASSATHLPIRLDLTSKEIAVRERFLRDAHITAQTSGTGSDLCRAEPTTCWRVNIDGNEIAGTFEWENAKASGTRNGKLQAAIAKLYLPKPKGADAPQDAQSQTPERRMTDLPQFALDIQRLFLDNREVGHLEIAARPAGDEWLIDDLSLSNPDGKLALRGRWRAEATGGVTDLLLETNIKNVDRFLTRFDLPEGLIGGDAVLSGVLQWNDAPHRFDLKTLSGNIDVSVGRGRFTKVDPGIGRLLAVFSLQALPRRITLDFRDVFSEGFSFDSIKGKTNIENGILTVKDLSLDGPSAKVKINGQVDLVSETQKLDVLVRANMSETLSVGAAGASMLVMSTPIGAAAVGLGALVGQLILDDPIGKMLSYEYRVEGSWSEPIVAKKTASSPEETAIP